jgi:hypothetical protein
MSDPWNANIPHVRVSYANADGLAHRLEPLAKYQVAGAGDISIRGVVVRSVRRQAIEKISIVALVPALPAEEEAVPVGEAREPSFGLCEVVHLWSIPTTPGSPHP